MPPRLNRALQVRTADRLRASLARDEISGLPAVGGLADEVRQELCEVGLGRLAAVFIHVAWTTDGLGSGRPAREVQKPVMRQVARLVDEQVRRTDLLGSLRADALLVLGAGADASSGHSLAQRLRDVFADRCVDVGGLHVQLGVSIGFASGSATSAADWTIQTLAEEAERNAAASSPIAVVA